MSPATGTPTTGTATVAAPEALPELEFVAGMPGFPQHRRFVLVRLDDGGGVYALRSLDTEGLRFLVVAPEIWFPGYAPELDDDAVGQLALEQAEDALVLVVVTPGAGAAEATANLLAPVVVNTRTRRAAQVLLTGSEHPLRAPLAA